MPADGVTVTIQRWSRKVQKLESGQQTTVAMSEGPVGSPPRHSCRCHGFFKTSLVGRCFPDQRIVEASWAAHAPGRPLQACGENPCTPAAEQPLSGQTLRLWLLRLRLWRQWQLLIPMLLLFEYDCTSGSRCWNSSRSAASLIRALRARQSRRVRLRRRNSLFWRVGRGGA